MAFKSKVNWDEEITNLRQAAKDGLTYQEIGNIYGVTRERVRQVIKKHIPEWFDVHKKTEDKVLAAEKYFKEWGNRSETPKELYSAQKRKLHAKRAHAKRLGYSWELSFGDVVWPTHCPILGIELNYFAESRQENSPSFDQIDAGKGYVVGNVQVLSWRANRIKNDGTAEEHRKIAEYLESL